MFHLRKIGLCFLKSFFLRMMIIIKHFIPLQILPNWTQFFELGSSIPLFCVGKWLDWDDWGDSARVGGRTGRRRTLGHFKWWEWQGWLMYAAEEGTEREGLHEVRQWFVWGFVLRPGGGSRPGPSRNTVNIFKSNGSWLFCVRITLFWGVRHFYNRDLTIISWGAFQTSLTTKNSSFSHSHNAHIFDR